MDPNTCTCPLQAVHLCCLWSRLWLDDGICVHMVSWSEASHPIYLTLHTLLLSRIVLRTMSLLKHALFLCASTHCACTPSCWFANIFKAAVL